jgi:hypothetical protein
MKSSSFLASTANDSEITVQRTDWNDLSQAVRDLVQVRTGPVRAARTVSAGLNSQLNLAAVLDTANGPLFVKGLRTDHPGVVRQQREAMINPHVLSLAPPLRWKAEGAGWNLLAFTYIPGARHADYSPGSADLPAVVQVINRLQGIPCPDLPVKRAEQRWAAYVDDTDLVLLTGATLLHTDFNPLNVLMTADGACVIDWAWPTRGRRVHRSSLFPATPDARRSHGCPGRSLDSAMYLLGEDVRQGDQGLRHRVRTALRRDRP